MSIGESLFVMLICCIFGLLLGWIEADNWTRDINRVKNEAVAKGYAEYFVDVEYHQQWRWKP